MIPLQQLEVREYLWYKNKSINYDSSNHPDPSITVYKALNFASTLYLKKCILKRE